MNSIGRNPFTNQFACQSTRTNLGVGKDDDLLEPLLLNDLHHRLALMFCPFDLIDLLGDILCSGVTTGHLDGDGVVFQKGLREFTNLGREGGREQKALTGRRQEIDDALQVGQKPHIEHAVGLIEHQERNLREVQRLLLHMVEEPTRRSDENFNP